MKRFALTLLILITAVIGYAGWLGYRIWDQSRTDEARPADAIVVLGAAQYNGNPSPVFKARLDHAADLYERGFADTVIVTGGKQEGDRYSEAEAGERYLGLNDVSSNAILQENRGRTTLQSLQRLKSIAKRHHIRSIVFVSDPLHSERIKTMARDLAFAESYTSPASYAALHRSRTTKAKELLHEITSLIGYELFQR